MRQLARILEGRGYTVWWDLNLVAGESWGRRIKRELDAAKCVIVAWSKHSVGTDRTYASEWIENEVNEAQRRKILVPVLLDEGAVPWSHQNLQGASLVSWRGEENHDGLHDMLQGVVALAGARSAPSTAEVTAWEAAESRENENALTSFIKAYPTSRFAEMARLRQQEITLAVGAAKEDFATAADELWSEVQYGSVLPTVIAIVLTIATTVVAASAVFLAVGNGAWWSWIVPLLFGIFGLLFVVSGLGWMFRGRPFKGGRGVIGGAVFLAVVVLANQMGLNSETYHRLSAEQRQAATIEFHQIGPSTYDVTITETPTGGTSRTHTFRAAGDDWLVSARLVRWKPWVNVFGLDAQYQFDRFDSRFRDVAASRVTPRSIFDLRPTRGLDFVSSARALSLIDTPEHGQAVYWPMADGAQYRIDITAQGQLLPDETNEQAAEAVAEWGTTRAEAPR